MFSSADELLERGEELEESIHPSRFDTRFFRLYLVSVLLTLLVAAGVAFEYSRGLLPFSQNYLLAGLALPFLLVVYTEIKRQFVMYHFTDRKVITEKGILNKTIVSVYYSDVTHTQLNQKIQERIFDVSDLEVDTAGEHQTELWLNGLKNPHHYKKLIGQRSQEQPSQQDQGQETSTGDGFDEQGQQDGFDGRGQV